jgi:site-specific DNA recombinase
MTVPMKTAIYARYSSDRQNARSIDAQIADCRARAEREGWPIVEVFTDYETSGAAGISEEQRPGMAALLSRVSAGGIDQVLSDSTSRIARDEVDGLNIRRLLNHHGARLFTLSIGEIDDIRGLITSFVDQQQRKDLAHNVRRGQREIVREQRAPAGIAYGYRQDNRLDERGQAVRGLRKIDTDQAAIVRRIFEETAAGKSALAIATALNAEKVMGPRGGAWRAGVIHGESKRGNGILRNRLYNGELVVGRTSKIVHPTTRKHIIRPNPPETWTIEPVEHLRIVDREVFERVQAMLLATAEETARTRPETYRRSKYLLSDLGICSVCGGGWVKSRPNAWGCGQVRQGACSNGATISHRQYEKRVLAQLKHKLLNPDLIAAYLRAYQEERARRVANAGRDRTELERKLAQLNRKIDRFVEAIAEDGSFPEIRAALSAARTDRDDARRRLDDIEAPHVVTLLPNLAEQYRAEIEGLEQLLADPHAQADAVPRFRSLIGRIIVSPARRGVTITVEGRMDQLLGLTSTTATRLSLRSLRGDASRRL